MTINETLIDLFSRVEDAQRMVRVSFGDGGIYDLQILSTGHAEAGGDILADVVKSIQSDCPERWEAAAMNFKLDDVVRVESGNECSFTRVDS